MIDDLNSIKEKIDNLEKLSRKVENVIVKMADDKNINFLRILISEILLLSKILRGIEYRIEKIYEYSSFAKNENPFNGVDTEYIAKNNKDILAVLQTIENAFVGFIDALAKGKYDSKNEDSLWNIFTIKEMLKETYGRFDLIDYELYGNVKSDIQFNEKKIRELSKLYKNLDNDFKELNLNYINFNSQISESFKKLSEININISTLENELSTYKNSINQQLSEFITFQKQYIDDQLISLLDGLNTKFQEANDKIKSQVEKVENTSKSFNEFISDETSIKLTNNFKEKSESEKKWYYFFNATSAIIIGVAIWMSYSSMTDFTDNHAKSFTQLDLYYLGIKLIFSFLIFSTVAFTNKLANKHYFHWKKNESTYLKLTALKSFIADMTPNKQQEIHEKLIDVYFGKEDLDPTIYKRYDNSSENILKLFADKLPSIGTETKKGN